MFKPIGWILLCVLPSVSALSASASSPAAWQAHDARAIQRCLTASQLAEPKVDSQPVVYSDKVGYTAILLVGRDPKSKPNRLALVDSNTRHELCLYQRKTHVARVQEWLPPNQ